MNNNYWTQAAQANVSDWDKLITKHDNMVRLTMADISFNAGCMRWYMWCARRAI